MGKGSRRVSVCNGGIFALHNMVMHRRAFVALRVALHHAEHLRHSIKPEKVKCLQNRRYLIN